MIRPRLESDLPACVTALAGVHETDRYPARWPADPQGWLTPDEMLGAWIVADGPVVLGHVALTRPDSVLADAVGLPEAEAAAVARLFVAVEARRSGLAAELLAHAAKAAIGEGLRPVLEVESGAAAAIALYERAGWRFAGSATADWIAPDGRPAVMRFYTG